MPQFARFSSQVVRPMQLAESPPKLKPRNGEMKPAASAEAPLRPAIRTKIETRKAFREALLGL
jgi:hypothetical protein